MHTLNLIFELLVVLSTYPNTMKTKARMRVLGTSHPTISMQAFHNNTIAHAYSITMSICKTQKSDTNNE